MQLGFYRTTIAALRLPFQFNIPRIGKTMSRGMKSTPDNGGKCLNSPINLTLTDKEQAHYLFIEDDFPPLSANTSAKQRKRDSKYKTSLKQMIVPLQAEASTSINITNQSDATSHTSFSGHLKQRAEVQSVAISNLYDTDLPAGFGKKTSFASRYPKHDTDRTTGSWKKGTFASRSPPKQHQPGHENGEAKRTITSPTATKDEPFDICLPETRKNRSALSSQNKKNRKMRRLKDEWPDENEEHIDDIDRSINIEDRGEEIGKVLRPGMVLFKHYISLSEQVDILNKCRELGLGPGGFYLPGYKDGAKLRLYMMCLGLDWNPQTKRYGDRRVHDDVEPPLIPQEFTSLVCRVLDDSHSLIKRELKIHNPEDELPRMSPDVCIVNFYNTYGRLGLHQDRDESRRSLVKGLPIVSISIGDSAEFLYGDDRDADKAERVVLESGDILIFGGESRHVFHGVTTIFPKTAPSALLNDINPGRLNLTFRKY